MTGRGLLIVVAFALPLPVHATRIDPLTWEELVLRADFVGVVECVVAGGIVARFKVVESWKGPAAGTELNLRTAVNFWEPQFPIALCGERWFVTAFGASPSRLFSTSGGGNPLWWRNVPADFGLPLFQGKVALPFKRLEALGEVHKDLDSLRIAVQTLLAASPDAQEAALLKGLARKQFLGIRWYEEGGPADSEPSSAIAEALKTLASAHTARETVERLAVVAQNDKETRDGIAKVLREGGLITAGILMELDSNVTPWSAGKLVAMSEEIRERLLEDLRRGIERVFRVFERMRRGQNSQMPKEPAPTEAALAEACMVFDQWRAAQDRYDDPVAADKALRLLIRHEPRRLLEWLLAWKPHDDNWMTLSEGYDLGSWFGWQCGKDRVQNLAALTNAKDPFMRVAGAVYLCFEDRESGMAKLRDLMQLEGDPGVWAALTLARRGDKSAMPRALRVFDTDGVHDMTGVPHRNLQKRLLVLLSNSAKASGVPWFRDDVSTWWQENAERIHLVDPWFEMLEKQKVD